MRIWHVRLLAAAELDTSLFLRIIWTADPLYLHVEKLLDLSFSATSVKWSSHAPGIAVPEPFTWPGEGLRGKCARSINVNPA